MSGAVPLLAGPWRFDELADAPELPDGYGYEVVDGRLVVTPPPADRHQFAVAALLVQLAGRCPPQWLVAPDLALRLGTDGRVPDLAVVTARASGAGPHPRTPADFGLVVEVVSPSSRKTDLFAKPGEYAEAGLPLFWRLDLDPRPVLHCFALRGGDYAEVAVVDGAGDAPAPWGPVQVDLTGLPER